MTFSVLLKMNVLSRDTENLVNYVNQPQSRNWQIVCLRFCGVFSQQSTTDQIRWTTIWM